MSKISSLLLLIPALLLGACSGPGAVDWSADERQLMHTILGPDLVLPFYDFADRQIVEAGPDTLELSGYMRESDTIETYQDIVVADGFVRDDTSQYQKSLGNNRAFVLEILPDADRAASAIQVRAAVILLSNANDPFILSLATVEAYLEVELDNFITPSGFTDFFLSRTSDENEINTAVYTFDGLGASYLETYKSELETNGYTKGHAKGADFFVDSGETLILIPGLEESGKFQISIQKYYNLTLWPLDGLTAKYGAELAALIPVYQGSASKISYFVPEDAIWTDSTIVIYDPITSEVEAYIEDLDVNPNFTYYEDLFSYINDASGLCIIPEHIQENDRNFFRLTISDLF